MPVSIGAPREHGFDEPLGLLGDCHRRIERFLDVMIRVVDRAAGRGLDREEREALDTALHYFDVAAPRHTIDEEDSLFPRMRASGDPEVRNAMTRLDALEADHRLAEAMHAEVARLCRRWVKSGPLPVADIERLRRVLGALRESYARHIAVEDNEVFPLARRVLKDDELVQVGREMAGRRGIGPTHGTAKFAQALTLHALHEEQVLYPATLLVGDYLKLRQAGGHGHQAPSPATRE